MTGYAPIRNSMGSLASVSFTAPSIPVAKFLVNGKPIPTQTLDCPGMGHDADNLELCEYLVAIVWRKTMRLAEGRTFPGVFANQNIVCKLRDAAPVEFLKGTFALDSKPQPSPHTTR
jgi:hypothetical protein